tara:strand:+ start:49 stop:639 length:591 start_codon:yes stop_codon:yes gene_type:complete
MNKKNDLNNIRQYKHLLKTTQRSASKLSSISAKIGSEDQCIQQFNKILKAVEGQYIVSGLLEPLDEGATYGEISIAYSHLLLLLDENLGDNPRDGEERKEEYRNKPKDQSEKHDFLCKLNNVLDVFDDEFQESVLNLGKATQDTISQFIKTKLADQLGRFVEEIKNVEKQFREKPSPTTNQKKGSKIIIEDEPTNL